MSHPRITRKVEVTPFVSSVTPRVSGVSGSGVMAGMYAEWVSRGPVYPGWCREGTTRVVYRPSLLFLGIPALLSPPGLKPLLRVTLKKPSF